MALSELVGALNCILSHKKTLEYPLIMIQLVVL